MNHDIFTVEEENLICAFGVSDRQNLVGVLNAALPDFDEPEMREIAENIIRKLKNMTNEEFSEQIFHPAYHNNDEETEAQT